MHLYNAATHRPKILSKKTVKRDDSAVSFSSVLAVHGRLLNQNSNATIQDTRTYIIKLIINIITKLKPQTT
jgi:hypothetical protein